MFGAIEAGGTKFVCGVGTGPADLRTIQFPTMSPGATIASAIRFLQEESGGELKAVGIGSFGPIDLHRASATFGYITSTPKAGWQNCNLAGAVRDALAVPVGFDTDVDAAALGDAIRDLADNPDVRFTLAQKAQARMGPNGLSSEAFVRRHVDISLEILTIERGLETSAAPDSRRSQQSPPHRAKC